MAKKASSRKSPSQKGTSKPILIVAILVVVAIALYFFIFNKNAATNLPGGANQTADKTTPTAKAYTVDEVLAFGGTCFTKGFTDATGDTVGQKSNSPKNVPAPEKGEFDTKNVAIGIQGDDVIVAWNLHSPITPELVKHTNFAFQIWYDDGPSLDDDRIEVTKQARENKWIGTVLAGDGWDLANSKFKEGGRVFFEPQVGINGSTVSFVIPRKFFSQNGVVDGIGLFTYFYDKKTSTNYTDNVERQYNKDPKGGHFTFSYCP